MTLTSDTRRTMVVTHTRAENQGQRSRGSTDKVYTDGQTDRQTRVIITLHCSPTWSFVGER